MPLNKGNALFAPKNGPQDKNQLRTETEDLRATCLAFVLGLRGSTGQKVQSVLGENGDRPMPIYNGQNVGFHTALMPGMVGTERFQQLCSLEYLHAYFHNVLSGKTISLNQDIAAIKPTLDISDQTSGPLGMMTDAQVAAAGNLQAVADMAKAVAYPGSEAALAAEQYQGIFARDFGPFLRGKGDKGHLVTGTLGNLPYKAGDKVINPFGVSRNLGDDLAFSVLDSLIAQQGLTDWRPDGIVLSKGVNDPSDKISDEMLEARDGQLYNLRVQGPAIGTTWTGEKSLETLPMDKLFILLVCDVWFDKDEAGNPSALLAPNGIDTGEKRKEYEEAAKAALGEGITNLDAFKNAQENAWTGGEDTVLANFRLVPSTSSQMVNYSQFKPKTNRKDSGESVGKKPKLEGESRMGLRLAQRMGQYVVGGWQIGNVMDTSASRAAMPQGGNIGVRTAPNSSALNVNVNIGWWSADRLCRAFYNEEGSITARHFASKPDVDNTGRLPHRK